MLKDLNILELDIEKKLKDLIQERLDAPQHLLFESARYSLLSPGKRLRPILTLATAQTFNIPLENALIPACALEMVHTYSLIHDDLPCIDDDDLRRGIPTLHKVYNEGHAVLTGDYLLTYAFELLSTSPHLTSDQKIALVKSLSQHAGGDGMIGGQVMDILKSGNWEEMHLLKTAALMISALEFGAIISNCSPSDTAHLKIFGKQIGLAFQIIDDILDGDMPPEARSQADQLYTSALHSLSQLSRPAPLLEHLAYKLIHRTT